MSPASPPLPIAATLKERTDRLREAPYQLSLRALEASAAVYRRRLDGVALVGVTGSAGKTTTKELIAAILGSQMPGKRTPGNNNLPATAARAILRTRPADGFCVVEVAAWEPGSVARVGRVLRPKVAVVTNVGSDHRHAFRTLEATAREKGSLLESVTEGGTAVLNADDPHVIAMANGFPGRVITFGRSPQAMLQADQVHAKWPERLNFNLRYGGRSLPVSTRLCGEHWTSSVLAALGVAIACGVSLEDAIPALAMVEPFPGRMSPVFSGGVTFIRDDLKAPWWSMNAAFEFLDDARAARKIAVIGTISDYPGARSPVYRTVARQALATADEVVFVGPSARHATRGHRARPTDALHACTTVREAAELLRSILRAGDLVLVKGSNRADHLIRAVLYQVGDVQCWRSACGKSEFCDACSLLHVPGQP